MIDSCAIVGCGTLGASLAIELAKTKTLSNLRLIDYDCVSGEAYPFKSYEKHISKVDVVRFLCLLENNDMSITSIQDKVIDSELTDGFFVIDCRDQKDKEIKSDIRLSLDGPFLVIDSSLDYELSPDSLYLLGRNEIYIKQSISIIIDYLTKKNYMYKKLVVIDVRKSYEIYN